MPLVMAEDSPVERSANRPATNALKQHEPNQVNVVVSSSNRKSRGSTLAFRDGHDDETKTTTKTTTKTKIETATTKGGNRQHSIIAVPEQAVVDNTKEIKEKSEKEGPSSKLSFQALRETTLHRPKESQEILNWFAGVDPQRRRSLLLVEGPTGGT
jgi:hypothetical protein